MMKGIATLFLGCSMLAQSSYDLLLQGGHVVDGKNKISAVMDVGELDDAGLIRTLTTFDTLLPPAATS